MEKWVGYSEERKSYRLGLIVLLNIINVWNFHIGKRVTRIFLRKKVKQAWTDYNKGVKCYYEKEWLKKEKSCLD